MGTSIPDAGCISISSVLGPPSTGYSGNKPTNKKVKSKYAKLGLGYHNRLCVPNPSGRIP